MLQHVIVRGMERSDIFSDDTDRQRFVTRFSALLVETNTQCFARGSGAQPLPPAAAAHPNPSVFVHAQPQTGQAITFNLRYGRSGHVFQNRYKSIVCEEEEYILALVRTIGLNPLRARLVSDLEALDRYLWSSQALLMGHQSLDGQVVDEVLARFAARRKDAVREYRAFVAAGVALGRQTALVGGGMRRSLRVGPGATERARGREQRQAYDDRILGSGEFVEALWKEGAMGEDPVPTLSLEELTERVARAYGVDAVEICRQRRLPALSNARAVTCYLAVRHLGYKGVEIGRHLGLGRTGASAAVRRGQGVVQRIPELLNTLGPQG